MFFQNKGFLYVHSPIITASDAEGAGEMFQVSCKSKFSIHYLFGHLFQVRRCMCLGYIRVYWHACNGDGDDDGESLHVKGSDANA